MQPICAVRDRSEGRQKKTLVTTLEGQSSISEPDKVDGEIPCVPTLPPRHTHRMKQ